MAHSADLSPPATAEWKKKLGSAGPGPILRIRVETSLSLGLLSNLNCLIGRNWPGILFDPTGPVNLDISHFRDLTWTEVQSESVLRIKAPATHDFVDHS